MTSTTAHRPQPITPRARFFAAIACAEYLRGRLAYSTLNRPLEVTVVSSKIATKAGMQTVRSRLSLRCTVRTSLRIFEMSHRLIWLAGILLAFTGCWRAGGLEVVVYTSLDSEFSQPVLSYF